MANEKEPRGYQKAKAKAEEILNDPDKTAGLLSNAAEKAQFYRQRLKDVWEQLDTLIQMAKAYRSGDYKHLPWKTIIAIMAAILYFVNPLDLVPDFLFGFGFVDDAAVIGFVVSLLNDEIKKFKDWQSGLTTNKKASSTNGSMPVNAG